MDRAVVIGTFEFLGFHFCRSLLEQGFEVKGVHNDCGENDAYITEKRMEFGRNANFNEEVLSKWLSSEEFSQQTLIIIDDYNFFVNDKMTYTLKNKPIVRFLKKNKKQIAETKTRILSLYPIHWLLQTNDYRKCILENEITSHRIFLPTIYGPWQPNSFLFQQSLLQSLNSDHQPILNENEWIHDALYIDDIIEPILKLATKSADTHILKSDILQHWDKCADYLSIPSDVYKKGQSQSSLDPFDINIKIIRSNTDYTNGLDNQKRHLMLLHEGRI